ncbi:hypothetical protein Tco_1029108 [Tanacetum coccineum]|uniref:Integrase catalytic domain-containing protein n=1 Tax=Tanacetum coccineum TaxID=301880 RepID=A0ABQ5G494_9ASTR
MGTNTNTREMIEFCRLKGKKELVLPQTPQPKNGVAKRKNRTLIKAIRTMLADSLLPTVFVLKQPPSISFMRPFGCPVTILNTLDPLGKFDGKAKEGFLVGYSVNSKAFRDKDLIGFFDIDSLTNSMNYQTVTAGNQTNKNAGPQETNGNTGLKKNVDARQSEEKNVSTQQYIVFPLCSSIFSSNKSLDETDEDDTADDTAGEKPIQKPASENEQALKNVLDKMMD